MAATTQTGNRPSQVAPRNWLLVPSPLLGPASWGQVATELVAQGHRAEVVSATMTTTADYDHITPWIGQILDTASAPSSMQTVVVTHSAACPRAPLLVDELINKGWDVTAMVLVDGRFPNGRAFTDENPRFAAMLDGMIRPDDYLPPWPRWWGSLVQGLVVDGAARDLVFNEAPPIPRHWFDQACPTPELPPTVGRGFLSFGPGYADALEAAFDDGWMTLRLDGDHLHQVVAPKRVAAALKAMIAGMACGRGFPQPGPTDGASPSS